MAENENNVNEQKNNLEIKEEVQKDVDLEKEGNKLGIIALSLFVLPMIITAFLNVLKTNSIFYPILNLISDISSIASFVLVIYIVIKYPKNKIGKVLLTLMIIGIVIALVIFTMFFATCMVGLSGLN